MTSLLARQGDPASGHLKHLYVDYQTANGPSVAVADEHQELILDLSGTRIIRAWYGDPASPFQGRGADVTKQVKAMVANGGHKVLVENSHFGDPAPGVLKILFIEYYGAWGPAYAQGKEHETIVLDLSGIQISRAFYGDAANPWTGMGADVTDRVRQLVVEGVCGHPPPPTLC